MKTIMNFVHLNVHSHYSKGWGVGTIEELCQAARDRGINKLALTDTNGLYGLVFFVQTAREMGIEPIVGSELLSNGHRGLLLVKNRRGYANLSRIISARHCHQDFDLIRTLREKREGLIVFSDDFKLLKALKQDSIEDLFVEMSPGLSDGQLLCLFPQNRHSPRCHQSGIPYQERPVPAPLNPQGRIPEQQNLPLDP